MKVLVTGGAGYIGSHVTHSLIEDGHTVFVLDNLYSGFKESVSPQANFVKGSAQDSVLLDTLLPQVEAVMHFAAHIEVEESVRDPLKYYLNNTVASAHLLKGCAKHKIKNFIFSSTAAVYGNSEASAVSEENACLPLNPYGHSKLMVEQMLHDLSQSGDFRFLALRYFNVAGAHHNGRLGQKTPRATHLIKVAAEAACGIRPFVEIFGKDYSTPDGTCIRDYIHVEDIASAHIQALQWLGKHQESNIFNCGYGHGFSVLEVLECMKKVSGVSFEIRWGKRRLGDAEQLISHSKKIQTQLGWKPRWNDLEVICRSAYLWEKSLKEF